MKMLSASKHAEIFVWVKKKKLFAVFDVLQLGFV